MDRLAPWSTSIRDPEIGRPGIQWPAEKWPIRIRTEVASEGGHVAVHISVSSDESPGLSRLASAQERYSRTVDRLLFELHERLSG
jgi:hypothetical protein